MIIIQIWFICSATNVEVTALRAKIAELHLKLSTQQKLVTQRAMELYNTLVSNLFNTSFSIKAQYERYR